MQIVALPLGHAASRRVTLKVSGACVKPRLKFCLEQSRPLHTTALIEHWATMCRGSEPQTIAKAQVADITVPATSLATYQTSGSAYGNGVLHGAYGSTPHMWRAFQG